jgi:hypothetical protein
LISLEEQERMKEDVVSKMLKIFEEIKEISRKEIKEIVRPKFIEHVNELNNMIKE